MTSPSSPTPPASPTPPIPPSHTPAASLALAPQYNLQPTPQAVAAAAGEHLIAAAREAINTKDSFLLVLAGGSTPKALHQYLVTHHAQSIDWTKVHFFFGDERLVPHTHESSNTRMAFETLLTPLAIPPVHIHPVPTYLTAHAAAENYESTLNIALSSLRSLCFDMVLLGMGADGHTLSLFPGQDTISESTRWCISAMAPEPFAIPERITLTLPAILGAKERVLLVTGTDKKSTLQAALTPGSQLPIALARPTLIITDIPNY